MKVSQTIWQTRILESASRKDCSMSNYKNGNRMGHHTIRKTGCTERSKNKKSLHTGSMKGFEQI